jgi:hypothetical protein
MSSDRVVHLPRINFHKSPGKPPPRKFAIFQRENIAISFLPKKTRITMLMLGVSFVSHQSKIGQRMSGLVFGCELERPKVRHTGALREHVILYVRTN